MRHTLASLFLLCPAIALCQTNTGTILGTVEDGNGYILPGAIVTIENSGTQFAQTLKTNSAGAFTSAPLPLGTYSVRVNAPGFSTALRRDITLRVSDRLQLSFELKAGDVQTVTVTEQAPLLETASTTLGGVVSKEQVADLPINGRSVTDLLALIPGVQLRGNAAQISVGGAGTFTGEGGLHVLLDGGDASRVDFDDVGNTYGSSAGRVSRASVDAVEEFRVYTDAYSAEYGQTQGGVVNLITKSGTNNFHGSLFEYFRNEVLDARDWFNAAPAYKPAYRLNQFGGTVGGPVKHDKLFFFGDYEGVRQRSGNILSAVVPTADARAASAQPVQDALANLPLPNGPVSSADPRFATYTLGISNPLDENTGIVKVDYQANSANRFTVRYNINQSVTQTYFGVARGQVQNAPGLIQLAMVQHTHVFTPQLINEATFFFNRFHIDPQASNDPTVLASPIVNFGQGAGVGPGLFNLHVANNSFTYQDNLTYVKGRHQLKFGVVAIRNQANKLLGFQQVTTFLNFTDAQQNQAFQLSTLGFPRIGMRNTYFYSFVQDNIRASKTLNVNLGLRYQYDTAPTESQNRIANFNQATNQLDPVGASVLDAPKLNFAPRIGVAYTPHDRGTTVFRGGFGIFYSELNAGNLGQNLPANVAGLGMSASVTDLQVPGLQGLPFQDISKFSLPTKSFSAIVKNYQEPYSMKWNFNVQQQLGASTVFQVGYEANRGLHLIESYDYNRLFPGGASRPLPQFGSINTNFTGAFSNYHSLQATFKKRFKNNLSLNANYTWSHSIDDAPPNFSSYQDDHNPRADYGNSDFDVRHNLEVDASYAFPAIPHVWKPLVSGWQYNTITQVRSGFPFSISCGCDPVGVGQASSRADIVPGVSARPANYSVPLNQVNLAAFVAPVGHFGDSRRNQLFGPRAVNFDMSLFRSFRVIEHQQLTFRAEAFNIFNHPQFSNPQTALNNPSQFGQSTSTLSTQTGFHTSRQLQFALRYSF